MLNGSRVGGVNTIVSKDKNVWKMQFPLTARSYIFILSSQKKKIVDLLEWLDESNDLIIFV